MDILLAVLLGGLVGGAAGWLAARLRAQGPASAAEAERARLESERSQAVARVEELRAELASARLQAEELRHGLGEREVALAALRTELKERDQAHATRLEELKDLHARFQDTFRSLSSRALESNNAQFLDLAKAALGQFQEGAQGDLSKRQEAIGALVKPLAESLRAVDAKIGDLEKAREGAYAGLREQISGLAQTQAQLKGETANLVQALRTPNVRGQWGEVQLEKTVRFAGMIEHVDFVQQESASSDEGRLRPDLIVRLPNGSQIVVDAKTPLDGYLLALEATEATERARQLARHARQIRDHIRKLGSKQYWKQFEASPEFVVLFLPGEAFFSAALEEDPSLIEFGTTENVILATPTTLIALLKAVAYGWRQEQIAQEAQKISDLGRELYERLATAGGHFERLGQALGRSVDAYNQAVRSIETRVYVTARKFQDLAPLSTKELPTLDPLDHAPRPAAIPEWEGAGSSVPEKPLVHLAE
jgi:DNA recombination protein RmuC